MCLRELRNASCALVAVMAVSGAAPAQHLPDPPRRVERTWYGQSFFQGGVEFTAGGYNGGRYRPTAYSAADVYVTPAWDYAPPPACLCTTR